MDPTRQIILITGVCLAFAIYAVMKFLQWRKKQSDLYPRPKMREKGTPPRAAMRRPKSPAQDVLSGMQTSEATELESPAPAAKELPVAEEIMKPTVDPALKSRTASNWNPEPLHSQSRTVFDEIDEEYPYADTDDYIFGSTTPVMASFVPTTDESRRSDTHHLRNAGYYAPHAWHNYTAIRYLGIVLPVIFFGVLLLIVPEQLEPWMMIGLLVGPMLGWALPSVYVNSKANRRLREISNGMPDMLDLLNMCVSQGMTVPTALGRVGREITPVYPDLAKELGIVTEQARIGDLTHALKNFSARVDVPEVHSFTSLLTQTERMGTSVSEALAEHSDNIRESIRQRSDQKANSATFKLLFPTVFCLMPAVYLFLLGPAVVEMNRFWNDGGPDLINPPTSQQFFDEESF